jgi:hypothetical protein
MIECRAGLPVFHSNEINPHLRPVKAPGAPMDYAAGCDIGAGQYADINTATCLNKLYPTIIIYRTNKCDQTATNTTVVMDPNLCKNLDAIYSGSTGYQTFNIYYEACPKAAMTPTAQMTAMMAYITNTCNKQIQIIYLAVDGTTGGVLDRWSASTNANIASINEYVSGWEAAGGHMFMYSAMAPWKTITGNSDAFSSMFLWYSHTDGVATVADWATYAFGGWTADKLAGKQYSVGQKTNCSTVPSFSIGQDIWLVP